MANKRDYYEVLGIDKNATDEDIKRAYRKKAKECHPDLHPNDKEAEARFKELNEANEVLSDPDKRARYDQFGFDGPDMGGGAGGNPFGGMDFSGMGGMGDIFDQLFNGGMGGSAQARRNAPRQGNDVRYELRLTFEEAAKGCHKSVEFYRYENCATCGGSGAKPGTQPQTCSMCKGTGQIRQSGGGKQQRQGKRQSQSQNLYKLTHFQILLSIISVYSQTSNACRHASVARRGALPRFILHSSLYTKNGIIPVGKHFPGHGETSTDSHKEMPEVNLSIEEMENVHIKPFKQLLNELPAIMVAHVHYSAFNKEKIPASISLEVIDGYLRNTLKYKGIVISDDMVMGGIRRFTTFEACKRAINAGVNMFIYRNTDESVIELIAKLIEAVKNGEIPEEKIDKSFEYIKTLKNVAKL